MLKRYGNSIAQISAIIILLGFLKQILYYTNFNLPIQYFLGIAELGTIIPTDLIIIIPILIIVFIFTGLETSVFKKNNDLKKEISDQEFKKSIKKLAIGIFIAISLAVILLFFISDYVLKLIIVTFLILFVFVLSVSLYIEQFKKSFPDVESRFILACFVILTSAVVFKTGFDIDNVQQGSYNGTTITTSDSSYVSTDSSYFIGKTEKYIFIYDTQKKGTLIIPSEKVEEMFITTK